MKGYGTSVPPVHAGIRQDLEALLTTFKELGSVRWKDFAIAFQKLDMGLIFAGRQSAAELVEFAEHLLRMCAMFMVEKKQGDSAGYPRKAVLNPVKKEKRVDEDGAPIEEGEDEGGEENDDNDEFMEEGGAGRHERADITFEPLNDEELAERRVNRKDVPRVMFVEPSGSDTTYVERIFGIYACYAFFYLQPTDYITQIRITPYQMREVIKFTQDRLIPERQLDVAACLFRLVNEGAFRIVAFEQCHDPSSHKRYETYEELDEIVPEDTEPPLANLKGVVEDIAFKQLELLSKRYEDAKYAAGVSDMSMRIGVVDVAQHAKTALTRAKLAVVADDDDNDMEERPNKKTADKNASRSEIKHSAYSAGMKANRGRRYAFTDAEQKREAGEAAKRGRMTARRIKEERANEVAAEMRHLGMDVVVRSPVKRRGGSAQGAKAKRRKNGATNYTKAHRMRWGKKKGGEAMGDGGGPSDLFGGLGMEATPAADEEGAKKKRGRRPEPPVLKDTGALPMIKLAISKEERKTDREFEKILKKLGKKE